jgi:hypothetical protein
MADLIRENPKDPLWRIVLQVAHSAEPSPILGADARPTRTVLTYHPECETTCHAPNEDVAQAYVVQQNPGALVKSVERVSRT